MIGKCMVGVEMLMRGTPPSLAGRALYSGEGK